ncbi:MAG: Hsp20/alpha crystallin family protein [Vicinamibacteria bacterium]
MTLVRWNPWRDFGSLARTFDRSFDRSEDFSGIWSPPVDIFDNDGEIVLKAELPGLKKEDIDINVEDNLLTLRGERKREKEVNDKGVFRSERVYGSFSRSFTLPTTVTADKINASYKDGVLTISLPKAEEAKPRQIAIQAA